MASRKEDLGDFYRELFLESFVRPLEQARELVPESALIAYSSVFRAHAVLFEGLAHAAEVHAEEVSGGTADAEAASEADPGEVTWKGEDEGAGDRVDLDG